MTMTFSSCSFSLFPIQGPEKHQFLAPLSEESNAESVGMGSVYEKKPVVGDLTAEPVLESLLYIAQLYGEPVLTYQYLPYIGYLVKENNTLPKSIPILEDTWRGGCWFTPRLLLDKC